MDQRELDEACHLLAAEFPDVARPVLEQALRETLLDIPAARRILLQRAMEQQQAQGPAGAAQAGEPAGESPSAADAWSWASWNQGIRDLGLESIGAQLSLLGRQVASSLNSILPEELALFGTDEEELEEEAARVAAKAEAEREAAAVVATGSKLQARRHLPSRGGVHSPRQRTTEGEEEEEDDDKLN